MARDPPLHVLQGGHASCVMPQATTCDHAASEEYHTAVRLFRGRPNVRFGSFADICIASWDVGFAPESRH